MDFTTIALRLAPYWIAGAAVIWATAKAGHKDLLRVEKPAVLEWIVFLLKITIFRAFIFMFLSKTPLLSESIKNINSIPIAATLFVFWEDAMHALPLVLLQRLIGVSKWTKPIHFILMALVMVEFGLGHLYQGLVACTLLAFYIPTTINLGKKYGFGTVMIGHTLFDLSTILFFKLWALLHG